VLHLQVMIHGGRGEVFTLIGPRTVEEVSVAVTPEVARPRPLLTRAILTL
jgi:hypothetical protein